MAVQLTDWSNAGVLPVAGQVIPKDAGREYLYVQNQDTTKLVLTFVSKDSSGNATTSVKILSGAASKGEQGGTEESGKFVIKDQVTITGTTGAQYVAITG